MFKLVTGTTFVAALALLSGCSGGTPTSASDIAVSLTGPLAYVQDVKPVLDANCTRCHSGSRPDGNVTLTSYAGVMRVVQPGNANSLLVRVTQNGGSMYGNFSGDRASKSALIRAWVVDYGAAETR